MENMDDMEIDEIEEALEKFDLEDMDPEVVASIEEALEDLE